MTDFKHENCIAGQSAGLIFYGKIKESREQRRASLVVSLVVSNVKVTFGINMSKKYRRERLKNHPI